MFSVILSQSLVLLVVLFSTVCLVKKVFAVPIDSMSPSNNVLILDEYDSYNEVQIKELLSRNYRLYQGKLNHKTEFHDQCEGIDLRSDFTNIDQTILLPEEYSISANIQPYLCEEYEQKLVYPKRMKTKTTRKWQTTVNQKGAEQSITIEECRNPGKHCDFDDEEAAFFAHRTFYKTEYTSVKMLSLTDDGQLAFNYFILPYKCKCHAVFYK